MKSVCAHLLFLSYNSDNVWINIAAFDTRMVHDSILIFWVEVLKVKVVVASWQKLCEISKKKQTPVWNMFHIYFDVIDLGWILIDLPLSIFLVNTCISVYLSFFIPPSFHPLNK